MKVYRIEHRKYNIGPYKLYRIAKLSNSDKKRYKELSNKISDTHNDGTHPIPPSEGLNYYNDHVYSCGFTNKKRLISWFSGLFDELNNHDFVIRVFDVQNPQRGKLQCIFNRKYSKLLKTIEIKDRYTKL